MPLGVGELEGIDLLISAHIIGLGQRTNDVSELFVIDNQRLVVGDKPREAAGRRKRIEVALETAGADVEAAGDGAAFGEGRGKRCANAAEKRHRQGEC